MLNNIKLSLHLIFLLLLALFSRSYLFNRQIEMLPQLYAPNYKNYFLHQYLKVQRIDVIIRIHRKKEHKILMETLNKIMAAFINIERFISQKQEENCSIKDINNLKIELKQQLKNLNDSLYSAIADLSNQKITGVFFSADNQNFISLKESLNLELINDDLLNLDSNLLANNIDLVLEQFMAQSLKNTIITVNFFSECIWVDCGFGCDRLDIYSSQDHNFIELGDSLIAELIFVKKVPYLIKKIIINDSIFADAYNTIRFRPTKLGRQSHKAKIIFSSAIDSKIDSIEQVFDFEVFPKVIIQMPTQADFIKPSPYLNGQRGGRISVEKLSQPIVLDYSDEAQKTALDILSFELCHIEKGELPKLYKLPKNMIPAGILAKIKAGDQIQIREIRAKGYKDLATMAFLVE